MYYLMPNVRRSNNMVKFFEEMERNLAADQQPTFGFRTDIIDEDERYVLKADLPGFEREEIDIELKDGVLTVSAKHNGEEKADEKTYLCRERRNIAFVRSFKIENIQEDNISAGYQNGVLTLSLPKKPEIIPQTRKIEIELN